MKSGANQSKSITNTRKNCFCLGASARKRAERTSRLVGAATQTGRLPSPCDIHSTAEIGLEDFVALARLTGTRAAIAESGGCATAKTAGRTEPHVRTNPDVILLRRPPALRIVTHEARPRQHSPITLAPLNVALGPHAAEVAAAAALAVRKPATRVQPTANNDSKNRRGLGASSGAKTASPRCANGSAQPQAHAPDAQVSTPSYSAANATAALTDISRDVALLLDSQEACLAALDCLVRGGLTAPTPPGGASHLAAHASWGALLPALRRHCVGAVPGPAPDKLSGTGREGGGEPQHAEQPCGSSRGGGGGSDGVGVRGDGVSFSLPQLVGLSRELVRLRSRIRDGGSSSSSSGGVCLPQGAACSSGCGGDCKGPVARDATVVAGLPGDAPRPEKDLTMAALRPLLLSMTDAAARHLEGQCAPQPESHPVTAAGPRLSRASASSSSSFPRDAGPAAGAVILLNVVKLGCCAGRGVRRLTEVIAAAAAAVAGGQSFVASLDGRSLQDMIWALGKLDKSVHTRPQVRQMLAALAARLAEPGLLASMSPVGLSMVVYGMGKVAMPYTDLRVRRTVAAAVAASASVCGPQALANMAWGLARTTGARPRRAPPASGSHTGSSQIPVATQSYAISSAFTALPPGKHVSADHPADGAAPEAALEAYPAAPELEACVELARAATRQLDRFKPREVANLLGGLSAIGALTDPRVAPLLEALRTYLSRRMDELEPRDLAELLYSYAIMARAWSTGPPANSDLAGRDLSPSLEVMEGPGRHHPQGAVWRPTAGPAHAGVAATPAVSGAAWVQHGAAAQLWAQLERRCLRVLPRSPPYQMVTMLWAFAHLDHHPAGLLTAVVAALTGRQPQPLLNLASLPAAQLSRLVWALARLGARVPSAGLRRLCGALRGRAAELNAQDALMASWGMANLGCPDDAALEELVDRLTALLPSLDCHQLPMALWSVAKLVTTPSGAATGSRRPPTSMCVLRFFMASRSPLTAALPSMAPQGVAMAAWAYATAAVNPGEMALATLWERCVAVATAAAAAAARPAGADGVHDESGTKRALTMVAGAMAEFRCEHKRLKRAVLDAAKAHLAAELALAPQARRADLSWPKSMLLPHTGKDCNQGCRADVAEGVWVSSLVCSLGRLRLYDGKVLELACCRARALAGVMTPREAVPLLWGLGVMARREYGHAMPVAVDPMGGRASGRRGSGGGAATTSLPGAVRALAEVIEPAVLSAARAASRKPADRRGGGGGGSGGSTAKLVAVRGASSSSSSSSGGGGTPKGQFDGGLLSMYLLACLSHRHRPAAAVLEAVSGLLRPLLRDLASHTLCEVAWALAALRPPPGDDMGTHAMLPESAAPNRTAAHAAEIAAATMARLYHVRALSQGWPRTGREQGPGRAASAKRDKPAGQARIAAAGASARGSPPVHSSNRSDGGINEAAAADADADAGPEPRQRGSGGGRKSSVRLAAAAGALHRPLWPLRWARPEFPLVLLASLQRMRQQRQARGGATPRVLRLAADASQTGGLPADPLRAEEPVEADPRNDIDPGHGGPVKVQLQAPVQRTPQASLVAPIYPPRGAVPAGMARSHGMLRTCLALLKKRVCVVRSELLTLEPLVKVSWAMCVLRMYTPRLFGYCAARAVCSSTPTLERRPALLRALVQVRGLLARQRPSIWRRLRLRTRWRRRRLLGATWNVRPADLEADAPPAAAQQLRRCRAALDDAAEAAGLMLDWRTTFEGDRHGVLRLGSRSACALLLVPPWEDVQDDAAAEGASAPPPLASATVAARLLLLRGWLVASVRVERWLALSPEEQQRQLVALHAQMRAAARARAEAMMAVEAAAEVPPAFPGWAEVGGAEPVDAHAVAGAGASAVAAGRQTASTGGRQTRRR